MVAFLVLISANAQNDPTRNLPLPRSAAFGCTCDSIDGSMKSVAEFDSREDAQRRRA